MNNYKKIILNVVSVAVLVGIFYFLGKELSLNWAEIKDYPFHFNVPLVALSSLVYAASFAMLAVGWHLLLKYFHHPLPFTEILLYLCATMPAKYVPGKVWLPLARMKLCHPRGVPNSITLLTAGIEGVMEILGGTYISILAITQIPALGRFSFLGIIVMSIVGVVLLIPRVFYFFVNGYLRMAKRPALEKIHHVSFAQLLLLQVIYLSGLGLMGLAQVIFLQAFTEIPAEYLPLLVSIGSFSYVASIIAIFAPGGLGVREGIWYLALKGITSAPVALVYSFVSRIWILLTEAFLAFIALPFILLVHHRVRKNASLHPPQ